MKRLKTLLLCFVLVTGCLILLTPMSVKADAAPPASRVFVESHWVNAQGHDIVVVYIQGYGSYQRAKIDGKIVSRTSVEFITNRRRMVVAFRETYDCGVLSRGTHLFTYQITPTNASPQRPDLYTDLVIEKE